MTAIVEAQGVGKKYVLGGTQIQSFSVRETLTQALRKPLAWIGRGRAAPPEFWALKDVSFNISAGEAVGIIGRNGAGKSTLLKILSRITSPTEGEVRLRGRVASLLEVGTGFHQELSGRENIFLNGAVMGMSRADIRARFDEIVAFAEVDQFLDTPVKRYSSGMYVRLAFAVAAHLSPEILVVDEVLAVGDASFQKKCLGKMQDVASGGRTVLFVSHNMAAVSRLCSRAILLQKGTVVADGTVPSVVGTYLGGAAGESPTEVDYERLGRVPATEDVRLLAARIVSEGMQGSTVDIRKPVFIEIDYDVLRDRYPINPNFQVANEEAQTVFIVSDSYTKEGRNPRRVGRYRARAEIPGNFLAEGMFSIDVALSTMDPVIIHANERGALSLHVQDLGEGGTTRGLYAGPYPGVVRPMLAWQTEQLSSVKDAS